MTNVLIISNAYPGDVSSGRHLRMHNFCTQLAERHACFLVYAGDAGPEADPESELGVIDHYSLPPIPAQGGSSLRHLRVSNASFLRMSAPGYLSDAQQTVGKLCAGWNIDVIVCLATKTAEIVMPIDLPKTLDYCDSRTLTVERMMANRGDTLTPFDRATLYLSNLRQRGLERKFLLEFDRTSTISEADRQSFLKVSRVSPDKVVVIPNGVDASAIAAGENAGPTRRSVAFWGNLDFPPNWTAVEYFYKEVFLPYLSDANVEWHIFGRGAGSSINQMASHEQIFVHGFVEDLFGEVAGHGVMANPMVEGSGLKNKVLEAFACGIPVVSSSLGIEAIEAEEGRHYLQADSPEHMATSIIRLLSEPGFASEIRNAARRFVEERYTWPVVGRQIDTVVRELATVRRTQHIAS